MIASSGSLVQIFVQHWGDNLQFYPNFDLFSTLGGINLDQDFFQVSKLSEDQIKGFTRNGTLFSPNSGKVQKKNSSPEMEHFFFPRIQVLTCAQIHTRVKLLEGMQMKIILKLLGGIPSNYWGGYYTPHPPRVSAPLIWVQPPLWSRCCVLGYNALR